MVLFDYHTRPAQEQAEAPDLQSATVPMQGMAELTDSAMQQLSEFEQDECTEAGEPLSLIEPDNQSNIAFEIDDFIPTPTHGPESQPDCDEPQAPAFNPNLVIGSEDQTPTIPAGPSETSEPEQTPTVGAQEPEGDEPERRTILDSMQEIFPKIFGQSKKKS